MKANQEPITSDPVAQAQWEAAIRAFRAEALRKGQEAQARFDAELRAARFSPPWQGAAPGHEWVGFAVVLRLDLLQVLYCSSLQNFPERHHLIDFRECP